MAEAQRAGPVGTVTAGRATRGRANYRRARRTKLRAGASLENGERYRVRADLTASNEDPIVPVRCSVPRVVAKAVAAGTLANLNKNARRLIGVVQAVECR